MGGSKRSSAVCFTYGTKLYIVLGNNNGSSVNDFWVYDQSSDDWSELRKITSVSDDTYDDDYSDIVRSNAVAFVMGDNAYITTGSSSGTTNKTWEYDFANDQWSRKTAFEGSARTGAIAFTVDDRGYVATGGTSGSYYDDLLEFYPDVTYNEND